GLFAWFASEEAVVGEDDMSASPAKLFPTSALWFFFFLACVLISQRDLACNAVASLSSLFLQKTRRFRIGHARFAGSARFVGSIVGNPLLSALSDGRRKRWIAITLGIGGILIILLPHVSPGWMLPSLVAYGFFFLAAFPIIEAALMQSVPDAVRGRVF